ncbi:hypothetical protein KEM48_014005 [Puccinia striiformis f. sp. tritici PST-130]|uniref:Uncharacterized protein n=1 Tax=Puccinia striiformis f. sp. tritici PST-78 TaxID=1165861 RepID=A0A0L0UX42_9BASI|nr:hypothetical protein KEM48_014005 [Puccinia striiformis f. sp. tritici PST-130]KNE91613.1 hypothetical protein PSTG_14965 [Puccinia striiformis f. sp. tritici PST-78]
MANPLASALDLIKAFLPHKDVADNQMVPALVHSGSQKRTLTALEVIERARETSGKCYIPKSSSALFSLVYGQMGWGFLCGEFVSRYLSYITSSADDPFVTLLAPDMHTDKRQLSNST